jgi:hypothetical protein
MSTTTAGLASRTALAYPSAAGHSFNANEASFPVCVDMGIQTATPKALKTLETVLGVLHNECPELKNLNQPDTYGHTEMKFYDPRNVTPCPGSLLPNVQAYRKEGPAIVTDTVTFPTGITMRTTTGFYQYWSNNGSTTVLGYPISDEKDEDGKVVQYFERARLELQPDGSITRGLVGTEAYVARYG